MAGPKKSDPPKPTKSPKNPKKHSPAHQTKRFPLQKIHELLERKFPSGTVKPEGAVFLTAVVEYLAVEILELTANVARSRINDKHVLKLSLDDIMEAIDSDPEIKELIDKVRAANAEAAAAAK